MKLFFRCFLSSILLIAAGIMSAHASSTESWIECEQINYVSRYDLSAPSFSNWNSETWTLHARYASDPTDSHSMLLSLKIFDQNKNELTDHQVSEALGEYGRLGMHLPFPAGHDAASGYSYSITNTVSGESAARKEYYELSISFDLNRAAPLGPYRISWTDVQTPVSVPWGLIMTKMDWSSPSCSYSLGAGDKKVSVTRTGDDVRISGGAISGIIRLTTTDQGIEDYLSTYGWHVPSGSYTFSNTSFEDDMYVWAYVGENYKITLENSVRTDYGLLCDLLNGADVEIINHTVIKSSVFTSLSIYLDTSCSFHLSGSGKILPGVDEEDAVFGCSLLTNASTNEEALENIRHYEGNITVDFDLVSVDGEYPVFGRYCGYLPNPEDPWFCEDVIDPNTGNVYRLPAAYIIKKSSSVDDPVSEGVLVLPDDLTRIESEAFRGVTAAIVTIPPSVVFIAEDAFTGSSISIIRGQSEYVREYALTHDFDYIAEG